MDYHLYQRGEKLGAFPLEELRRRRQAGELTGTEQVWLPDTDKWYALDAVLNPAHPPGVPPALPKPASLGATKLSTKGMLIAAGVMAIFLVLGGAGVGLYVLVKEKVLDQRPRPTGQSNLRIFINGSNIFNARGVSSNGSWGPFTLDQPHSRQNYEIGSRPIPIAADTKTEKDVRKAQRAFRELVWVEGYKQNGRRTDKTDAAAVEFLESWMEAGYGDGSKKMAEVRELGAKLAANPDCTDPLVLSAIAAISSNHIAAPLYERALVEFPKTQHKAYAQLFATVNLATVRNDPSRVPALDAAALKLAETAFADGSFPEKFEAPAFDIFYSQWGKAFFNRNAGALHTRAAGKPSGDWLALMLKGESHVITGWKARGGGFIDTVSNSGLKIFEREMEAAADCFTKAWNLRRDLPQASDRMIYVSMGLSEPQEMRVWFDRAVNAQIDHPGAWANFRWALRPRWYGGHATLLALGVAAVNTGRFDTDVPRKLFDVITDIESELPRNSESICGRPEVWPHLQRMYEGYLAEASQTNLLNGWRTSYAMVAYRGKRYDVARTQLEQLNWTLPVLDESWCVDLGAVPLEVAARTSPAAEQVKQGELLADKGDAKGALQAYRSIANAGNLEERARQYIGFRQTALAIEERLQSGDWVNLMTTGDNSQLWNVVRGQSRPVKGAMLELDGKEGHLAFCRARVGANFEIRGEFEVASPGAGVQMGFVFGQPLAFTGNYMSFQINRNPSGLNLVTYKYSYNPDTQTSRAVKLKEGVNTFTFTHLKRQVQVTINGEKFPMQAGTFTPNPAFLNYPEAEYALGLGFLNPGGSQTSAVRYRNVQVRTFTTSPENGTTEINIPFPR